MMSEDVVHFLRLVFVLSLLAAVPTAAFLYFGAIPLLGKLPGDFFIPLGGTSLYLPVSSSILISVVMILAALASKPRANSRNKD